jgi:hypothetical protein
MNLGIRDPGSGIRDPRTWFDVEGPCPVPDADSPALNLNP